MRTTLDRLADERRNLAQLETLMCEAVERGDGPRMTALLPFLESAHERVVSLQEKLAELWESRAKHLDELARRPVVVPLQPARA